MNIDRTTTIEVVVGASEIITALKNGEKVPVDLQAIPSSGQGVTVSAPNNGSIKLTYMRKADVGRG